MSEIKEIRVGGTNYDLTDKNIATIEDTSTASQAYSVGEYLAYNGILYKVTTAISKGDPLTVGSNIASTLVGNELKAVNSAIDTLNANLTNKADTSESSYYGSGSTTIQLKSLPCLIAMRGSGNNKKGLYIVDTQLNSIYLVDDGLISADSLSDKTLSITITNPCYLSVFY